MPRFALLIFTLFCLQLGAGLARGDWNYYLGAVQLPLEISGVEDIAVSDWQNYGLGPAEGRVVLPLSGGAAEGSHWGAALGAYRYFTPRMSYLMEGQIAFASSTNLINLLVGLNWDMLRVGRFTLGFMPKIGYALGYVNFGKTVVLPGKTPPIITPEGTFDEGEEISASLGGFCYQVAVQADYAFTDKLSLTFQAGWVQAFFGNLTIKAGDVNLDMDSPAVVKNDGSAVQAGISPLAKSEGLGMTIGLTLHL